VKLVVLSEHLGSKFGILLFQVLLPLQILVVLLPLLRLSFEADKCAIGLFDDLVELLLAEAILQDLARHRWTQLLLRFLPFNHLLGYLLVFEMLRNVMRVCLDGRMRARVVLR
jgi:hypothetical protein